MNTVSKGNDFELRMFERTKRLLANQQLPVPHQHSTVFLKKGYYSEKRKGNIIVDISIECTLSGEPKPSLYVMIECKDYSHAVPVDDIEEFYAKTQQITGLNVKAMMLTTNILQEGALNFAQANGIRVMRIKANGHSEVLSFRKEQSAVSRESRDYINATLALTNELSSNRSSSHVGIGPGKVYFTYDGLIMDTLNDRDSPRN